MAYYKISGLVDEAAESGDIQLQVLKKLNMAYIEPRCLDGEDIAYLSDEKIVLFKKKIVASGIKVSAFGSPIGKINLADDFEEHFALFKRVVEITKFLGTKYIRMFSFYHNGDTWTEEDRQAVFTRLRRLIDYAKEQDVILLHENETAIYGDTADRCADLMNELGCDHFKFLFDTANFVQCKQDTKYAYNLLKDHIAYMHVKDAFLDTGRVVPAGYGDGNMEYVLEELFKNGFDGYLSLEPHIETISSLADLELGNMVSDLPESREGVFTLTYRALCDLLDRIHQ